MSPDVLEREADAFVFDDDRHAVRVVLQGEQEPSVPYRLGVAHDVRAEFAHDELDVGDVLIYNAGIVQQSVSDAAGDPQ